MRRSISAFDERDVLSGGEGEVAYPGGTGRRVVRPLVRVERKIPPVAGLNRFQWIKLESDPVNSKEPIAPGLAWAAEGLLRFLYDHDDRDVVYPYQVIELRNGETPARGKRYAINALMNPPGERIFYRLDGYRAVRFSWCLSHSDHFFSFWFKAETNGPAGLPDRRVELPDIFHTHARLELDRLSQSLREQMQINSP